MTASLRDERMAEAQDLIAREFQLLKMAGRSRRLAEEAAFFGEDDYYDYLLQAESLAHEAQLCGSLADELLGVTWSDSSLMSTLTNEKELPR